MRTESDTPIDASLTGRVVPGKAGRKGARVFHWISGAFLTVPKATSGFVKTVYAAGTLATARTTTTSKKIHRFEKMHSSKVFPEGGKKYLKIKVLN